MNKRLLLQILSATQQNMKQRNRTLVKKRSQTVNIVLVVCTSKMQTIIIMQIQKAKKQNHLHLFESVMNNNNNNNIKAGLISLITAYCKL